MKTVTINTNDLTGKALDWAVGVAVSIDGTIEIVDGVPGTTYLRADDFGSLEFFEPFEPTTNWSQLGPLVDEYIDSLDSGDDTFGIAACRAIVAAKLGDTVDVPEVLV